ncbi:mRNA decay activator protein ZFP36-like isoform X2 [Protopterus annectens]|uniref:mRNA decay activator protein ZFP36-like isoform X2 n=1 Tax=Protopterus annectens TaxID=7888 RepID=UPI001CF99B4B|nr:mRNA decay activator protein ZFP36-like isoform X2 [Protopterus annectens]
MLGMEELVRFCSMDVQEKTWPPVNSSWKPSKDSDIFETSRISVGGSSNKEYSSFFNNLANVWSSNDDSVTDPVQKNILQLSDRSKSVSEALLTSREVTLVPPPPGFGPLKKQQLTNSVQQQQQHPSRYKTELCRTFKEFSCCKYGAKCQFAHGIHELRTPQRHPKYKTEICKKFYLQGECPYGSRCNFIHPTEAEFWTKPRSLRHSVSYAGMSNRFRSSPPLPDVPETTTGIFTRAHSVSPPPVRSVVPEDLFCSDRSFQRLSSEFRGRLGSEPQPRLNSEECCCSCRCLKTGIPGNSDHMQRPPRPFVSGGSPSSSSGSLPDLDVYSSSGSLNEDFVFWEHNFGQK